MTTRFNTLLAACATAGAIACTPAHAAQNVFIMISDGASFGAWDMGGLAQTGSATGASYFGADFSKYLMTTYPLNTANTPTGGHTQTVNYDPAKAWDSTANAGSRGNYANKFDAFDYLKQNYTDSAAAGTALSAGVKTYNNAINWDNDPVGVGAPLISTPEVAKQNGMAVGTISSVQWSHATPAAFSNANNISRNDYLGIANQMLNEDVMDVVMGAGNPWYDDNGQVKASANYTYVGGETTWNQLTSGTHTGGWTLAQTKEEFEDLADGDGVYKGAALPDRLVGTPQVGSTLQQGRSGYASDDAVYEDPLNQEVPDLATMTKAAINLLDAKSQSTGDNGFFLQIEGGAVDWAAHANQASRIVEEQIDFNKAVDAVIAWIEGNGGWEENLLVITTDHGNAMPLGADANSIFMDRIAMDDLLNPNGPSITWFSNNHTNELVPVFVRGAGSEIFDTLIDGNDPNFATYYADWAAAGFDGNYIDNTDIAKGLQAAMAPVPEPTTMLLFGMGVLALTGLTRRRS